MTDYYYLWLDSLVKRDQTLLTLAVIAIYIVASWLALPLALRHWPPRIQTWARHAFLIGGVILYGVTYAISGG